MSSGLTLASDSARFPTSGLARPGAGSGAGMGMGLGANTPGSMPAGGMDGLDGLLRRGGLDDLSSTGIRPDASTASLKDMNRTVRLPDSRGLWGVTIQRDAPGCWLQSGDAAKMGRHANRSGEITADPGN